MIRYEIEKKLLEGSISVNEVPLYWNEHYRQYLGVEVPDDKRGCLQDVHWSHGSFGYFPTYSQGSFYAAQFYACAQKDIGGLAGCIRTGDNQPLLNWLREKVHRHGRFYTSEELCREISGEGLNADYFVQYLLAKYRFIYEF
jgi:carboxypeptidase Taq